MSASILIIEDDLEMLASIERAARSVGLQTSYATDGEDGLAKAHEYRFDLLVVDVNLPGCDGFHICERVREANPGIGIVFVTCRESELDRIRGFHLGADDYVLKPFSEPELGARLSALLRRLKQIPQTGERDSIVRVGGLVMDFECRTLLRNGKKIELTTMEFDLLGQMIKQPGRVFTRDELTQSVWGYDCSQFGPTITSYISRIRSKLEDDPLKPRIITTIHGMGYRLTPD